MFRKEAMKASVLNSGATTLTAYLEAFTGRKCRLMCFAFGDSREMAHQFATLVREGVKTATCSALWTFEEEQKPLPQRGDHSVVLDGNCVPVTIIQTVEVFVVPFNEVPERFAYDEGEGDPSLAYWRVA